MSEETPHRMLYLIVEGLPEAQRPPVVPDDANAEVFTLTETNAPEALAKIFAADAISVWGEVQ
jgi:hypothetical protein